MIAVFQDINECSSAPCLNGGSCVDHVNGYTCSCVPGYTGVHCETDMSQINIRVVSVQVSVARIRVQYRTE